MQMSSLIKLYCDKWDNLQINHRGSYIAHENNGWYKFTVQVLLNLLWMYYASWLTVIRFTW